MQLFYAGRRSALATRCDRLAVSASSEFRCPSRSCYREKFWVSSRFSGRHRRVRAEELFAGRSQWLTLISEVLPRALLAELGLSRMLLGTSGGGQFLLVLPGEARGAAEQFLTTAAQQMADLGSGHLKLLWSVTENLGDWSVVRKRLTEELQRKRATPLTGRGSKAFSPSSRRRRARILMPTAISPPSWV